MRLDLAFCLLLIPTIAIAQPQPDAVVDTTGVQRVQYSRLDHLALNQRNIFTGKDARLEFNLVKLKNLDTNQALKGVEVSISRQGREQIGGSIALSAVGSLFGASAAATYRKIQESGYIFLRASDLAKITDFLEEYPAQIQADQRRIWKIWLTKDFELGVEFSPNDYDGKAYRTGYSFLVTAGGTAYRMGWDAGLKVTGKLRSWHEQLSGTSSK